MSKLIFSGVGAVLLLCVWSSSVQADERRFALVIGNADYQQAPLKNPINDATDIGRMLETFDFDVTRVENVNLRAMETAIRRFNNRLDEESVALFYFAGHGLQTNGQNYLIPVDADIENSIDTRYEAVPLARVLDGMEKRRGGLNLIVLDACRNEPYPYSDGTRSQRRGFARTEPSREGTYIMYATRPGQLAADGNGRNGIFTGALLDSLTVDPSREIEQLFKDTSRKVKNSTGGDQIPWTEGVVLRDFSFAPSKKMLPQKNNSPIDMSLSIERDVWKEVQRKDTKLYYDSYLKKYPDGEFEFLARLRVAELVDLESKEKAALRKQKSQMAVDLVVRIKQRIENYKLTTPPGDNANDLIRELATLEPEHEYIQAARQILIEQYKDWIERAVARSDFDKAEQYLGSLERVDSSDAYVKQLDELIRETKEDTIARRFAKEQEEAERSREQREAIAKSTNGLVEAIERNIDELRLTKPKENNALSKIKQLELIDPSNSAIPKARGRILTLYEGWIRRSVSDGNILRAEEHLSSVKLVTPDMQVLNSFRSLISKAKDGLKKDKAAEEKKVPVVVERSKCIDDVSYCVDEGISNFKAGNAKDAGAQFVKACDAGISEACMYSGIYFESDPDVRKKLQFSGAASRDYDKAAEYYKKGCAGKHFEACSRLGILTYKGLGVRRNYRRAGGLFEQGCIGKDGLGCALLSNLYELGQGVFKNPSKAKVLDVKACEYGYIESC